MPQLEAEIMGGGPRDGEVHPYHSPDGTPLEVFEFIKRSKPGTFQRPPKGPIVFDEHAIIRCKLVSHKGGNRYLYRWPQ